MDATSKPRVTSDAISYTCTCPAQTEGGQVLLFYRYWENSPTLPLEHAQTTRDPKSLAEFHRELSARLKLGGKFRFALEGFNITLGGTTPCIAEYIEICSTHWSYSGINLSTPSARNAFFKPTPGCACAFANTLSIKITSEITPLGITNYAPSTWSNVISLSPASFHKLCKDSSVPLIDVRNHYESRIGHFVTATIGPALLPPVRRFSQFPGYVTRHVLGNEVFKGPVATYCTGGIRCEKGARWMQEALAGEEKRGDATVYTLQGGIVAYQAWVQEEVEEGRMEAGESFFKGRNYVFDGRGAIGGAGGKVSTCHGCGEMEDRLGKCEGVGCHLVLVVCEECEQRGRVRCCEDCADIDGEEMCEGTGKARRMCRCESDREGSLWGNEGAKIRKAKTSQQ